MTKLNGLKGRVADQLFELGAVKFGGFRLKLHETQPDAPLSPIYLNLRTADHPKNPGPLNEEVMRDISELFGQVGPLYVACFADIPDAGAPFGDAFVRMQAIHLDVSERSMRLTLYKKFRDDGTRYITDEVDGDYEEGWTCLVIDDLITQAGSKLEAISTLEAAGLDVDEVLVLVDRQQGGREQLEHAGYRLRAVFTLDELLEHYVSSGVLDPAKAEEVTAYIRANSAA